MTTFSIVTPSYNQGKFIGETIESVLSQEGDFSIEYLIMDGGSTDDSVEIIKKYDNLLKEGRWPVRCRGIEYAWVSEKDEGQVDAIEKGLDAARGDIFGWLNSDDVYSHGRVFETVLKEFIKDPELSVVTGDGLFIDHEGRKLGEHRVKAIDLKELLYLDYHILQPSTFFKKRAYEKERLDRSYNYCFDAEYFIRLILKGYKYRKIESVLSSFRFHPGIKTLSGRGFPESLRISRTYGKGVYNYAVSAFYKYWIIVLMNRHPSSSVIKALTMAFRTFAYILIIGKVR